MKGTITRIIDKGVVVEIKHGVEGNVPNSQLAFAPVRNVSQFFRIGDILPLKIIEFDAEQRKIILSAVDALRSLPEDEQAAYFVEHPVPQSDSNAKSDILVDLGDAAAPLESEFAFGDLADFKPNYSDSDINTSLKTDDFIETNVINDVPILNEINEAPSVEEISTTLNKEEVIVESQAVVQEVVNSTESEVEVDSNTIVAEDSSNNEKNPDIEG
jgi:predicted RNA-binding protein with RPS1 domain